MRQSLRTHLAKHYLVDLWLYENYFELEYSPSYIIQDNNVQLSYTNYISERYMYRQTLFKKILTAELAFINTLKEKFLLQKNLIHRGEIHKSSFLINGSEFYMVKEKAFKELLKACKVESKKSKIK